MSEQQSELQSKGLCYRGSLAKKSTLSEFSSSNICLSTMFFAAGGYSPAFFNSLEKNKKAPVVLGAGCLKLRPLEKDKFKTVNALDRISERAVSFEFVLKPGWFIRSLSTDLVIERRRKDADYGKPSMCLTATVKIKQL